MFEYNQIKEKLNRGKLNLKNISRIILLLITINVIIGCSWYKNETSSESYNEIGTEDTTEDEDEDTSVNTLTINGRVVDGPIKQATCYIDLNKSLSLDSNEPSSISDDDGYYTVTIDTSNTYFKFDETKIICQGGIDTITQETHDKLTLSTNIPSDLNQKTLQTTPLTTLISADTLQNRDEKIKILSQLGINEPPENITKTDYFNLLTQGTNLDEKSKATEIVKINYQIMGTLHTIENTIKALVTTGSIEEDISSIIMNSISEKLKIEQSTNSSALKTQIILESIFQKTQESLSNYKNFTVTTNSQKISTAISNVIDFTNQIENINLTNHDQIKIIMTQIKNTKYDKPSYLAINQDNFKQAIKEYIYNKTNAINLYGDISTWDVSNITDMSSAFMTYYNFNEDISNWDTSNVTNMNTMFSGASSFNQNINNWDVSNVTNMNFMFNHTSSFNQPLNSWNVSNVTSMNKMFFSSGLNQNLDNWDVSNVTSMTNMFKDANNLSNSNKCKIETYFFINATTKTTQTLWESAIDPISVQNWCSETP